MSAAQWLVELKTQSEVIDTDVRNVSSEKSKLTEHSSAGQIPVSVPEAMSKSENEKDLCFSDSVFVRRRGNALFPLDGVALSSSELAQESASGSPLSVVFPWSPRTWTQGTNGAVEAVDIEGVITNHKEHNRDAGLVASAFNAPTTENDMELHCCPRPQTQSSAAEEQQESPGISLEVYLGDDIDVVAAESIPIPSSIADIHTYSCSECAAKDSEKETITNDFNNTFENPDKDAPWEIKQIRREGSARRIKGKRRIGREGGERVSRRYKALATVCS
ncbi:hypothetical protein O6H91_22G013800 [Diphasiastrum complanatum]|nr:hypothetical protein O6H91_22G013800 [Diphasiastrum complanatum]